MQVLSLLGRMTMARYEAWKAHGHPPVRTPTPLGLHQGSAVEISPVPLVLAQSVGSLFPDVPPNQTVISVGSYLMFGQRVYRSYLSDGRSFIQTVADAHDPTRSVETRLYTLHVERIPGSSEDIAFLLGSVGRTEWNAASGREIVVEEATPALIGWPLFQVEDASGDAVLFPRLWTRSDVPMPPVDTVETLADSSGAMTSVRRWTMQYGRLLGDKDGPSEFLIAEFFETDDGAAFNASVGLDLDGASLTVLASI